MKIYQKYSGVVNNRSRGYLLVCGFKNSGWSRISSIDVGEGKVLVKFNQALSICIKKSSLLFFCKLLCLVDRRIWFYLKRAKPWLDFKFRFSQYSMRSFQRASWELKSLRIHLILRAFSWVSISKTPKPPLHMGSWIRCLGGQIFLPIRNHVSFFQFAF